MPLTRRFVLGASLVVPGAARAESWGAPPTPAASSPGAPQWPPRRHFALWPGRPPGAPESLPIPNPTMNGPLERRELWLRGIAEPIVAVYRPTRPDGRAVLSIPGGGYGFVSVQNEGIDVATALTKKGITVFVLAYRLPGEGWANRWDVPLQDAQRAMRLIRARASTWGIDPAKLGIVGFSAGGHLGASLAVGHDDAVYEAVDAADRESARPAFAGLVYPVISFSLQNGSSQRLLGENREPAIVARYNTDARVTSTTPPIFLAHAMDDPLVPISQSLAMLTAAQAAKVPVEAHLFERGGHGFGTLHLPESASGRLWTELFVRWMSSHVG